jgi:hypothetical protein
MESTSFVETVKKTLFNEVYSWKMKFHTLTSAVVTAWSEENCENVFPNEMHLDSLNVFLTSSMNRCPKGQNVCLGPSIITVRVWSSLWAISGIWISVAHKVVMKRWTLICKLIELCQTWTQKQIEKVNVVIIFLSFLALGETESTSYVGH